MIQNIYGMAMWSDGGLTMHKPYISGDGYIMKMSTYTKEKDTINKETGKLENVGWNSKWYALYYDFINKNRNKLKKTYYAGMIKNYDKKSKEEKSNILQIVKSI
jgi:deoxyribodipyrimidine photolyase-related protein